ncbi:hypothetical protein D9758_011730 [Tetrapyrgos nigripes]|uniref:Uncharacterized protein n=1 Tax=Tetrapyrgos nigripes TaxID=182062 RepID=A0A8H5GD43_9AGAR|nr:hypothetical protein D9758_011730 [Tetrapyrgos nigripes]
MTSSLQSLLRTSMTSQPSSSTDTPLSLTEWAQSRINSLYELHSTSESAEEPESTGAGTKFSSIFAPNAVIYHNHSQISVEEFQKEISQAFGAVGSNVEWKECVESPESKENSQAGIVAGFLHVTRTLKFRIRASPAKNNTFICISAKIEEDPTFDADEHGDHRRITQLFHTSVSKAAPVHFHTVKAQEDSS